MATSESAFRSIVWSPEGMPSTMMEGLKEVKDFLPPRPRAAPFTSTSLKSLIAEFGLPAFPEDMSVNDLAMKLLKAAAEVEHGLLVDYLYAASSVKDQLVRRKIVEVAIQEMGHLITVENLIIFLGGSPYYGRMDNVANSEYDPFPFVLDFATKKSLAKYLIAEMPELDKLDGPTKLFMQDLIKAGGDIEFHRVGLIYALLYWLFQDSDKPQGPWKLDPDLFRRYPNHIDSFGGEQSHLTMQADPNEEEWHTSYGPGIIFRTISSRGDALQALFDISAQGEGSEPEVDSHFHQFLALYKAKENDVADINLPVNPTLANTGDTSKQITDPLAILWVTLHNLQYNFLLTCLESNHLISREDPNPLRKTLINWSIDDMIVILKKIVPQILSRPLKAKGNVTTHPAAPVYSLEEFKIDNINRAVEHLIDLSLRSKDILDQLQKFQGISTPIRLLVTSFVQSNNARIKLLNEYNISA